MDAAQCGAFVGAVFGGASLILTGDVGIFALDSKEEKDIGDSLALCLETLPPQIGDTVSLAGPWAKLGTSLGGAVLKRMAMVAQHKAAQAAAARVAASGPTGAPTYAPQAPKPQAAHDPRYDGVVAPAPVAVGL